MSNDRSGRIAWRGDPPLLCGGVIVHAGLMTPYCYPAIPPTDISGHVRHPPVHQA